MMPDRYDELRKRLAVKRIRPIMSEPTVMEDSPLDLEPLQVEGTYQKKIEPVAPIEEIPVEPVERQPSSMDGQSAMYLGDLAASAGPSILALLGGASPSITTSLMNKGNQYAVGRGKQEEITKDKISVIDNNGSPENILTRDAVGKKPYYQSKLGGVNGGREFAPVAVKNLITGKTMVAKTAGGGYYHPTKGEMLDPEVWLPFKTDDIIREKTLQGGSITQARDKYTGKLAAVSSKAGVGDRFGGISKEEAQAGIGDARKAKDKSTASVEAYENARSANQMLSDPTLTPEKAAAGIYRIVKAINGERVSDSDYANLRGVEFKSYIRQVEDWASGKLNSRPSPKAIDAFRQISKQIMSDKQKEAEAIKKNYVPSNLVPSKSGQKLLDTMSNKESEKPKSEWKSNWR
jgi:hypothetical protein